MKAYVRLVYSDELGSAMREFGEEIYTPRAQLRLVEGVRRRKQLESKSRKTLLFLAVCFSALAFVAGMSWPLP